MLPNQSFTDPQGQSFTNAVIRVKSAQYNRNWYGNENTTLALNVMDPSADLATSETTDTNENQTVQVEFAYWPDQDAFDTGRQPYTLTLLEGDRYSTVHIIDKTELAKPVYESLSLEAICETYLSNEILPNLT